MARTTGKGERHHSQQVDQADKAAVPRVTLSSVRRPHSRWTAILQAQDANTVEPFESALAAASEVIELRRLFGKPDYFVRVAVADLTAYKIFSAAPS